MIALGSGYPDPALCPSGELAALAASITRENPRAITDYLPVEGLPELRERLAELGRDAGYATSAGEILVTTGARQAIDLVARAILGPGDVAVVESPTFAGALAGALASALERHLAHDALWTVPDGGNHIWVTMRDPVDERALYVEALRTGTAFLPGGAVMAEKSSRTSMRLSFGLVEPALLDEGVRRLAVALREVRRRGRAGSTGALS